MIIIIIIVIELNIIYYRHKMKSIKLLNRLELFIKNLLVNKKPIVFENEPITMNKELEEIEEIEELKN